MSVMMRRLPARCLFQDSFPAASQSLLKHCQSTTEPVPESSEVKRRGGRPSEESGDPQGEPRAWYIAERQRHFEKLKRAHEEMVRERQLRESRPIEVRLASGQRVEGEAWKTSPYHVARAISPSLAGSAVVARVNGQLWDLLRPLEGDSSVEFLPFGDPAAQA
ncbi:threonine--tRNA ligase 1, cytoplasmic-like, partial [Hemiscyllium ocellatum]|uniref:threonine--tRNA ligase 1, cytoplasmic-like n=1 Tax=Hemiscyllium ocellatum TaxID=170820 RepID=UPI0029673512